MTPDEICLAVLAAGLVTVEPETGLAWTHRGPRGVGQVRRQLGTVTARGYVVATLHFAGTRKQIKVHRLVWLAVNGTIPADRVPDHINGVKHDNRITNLRLVTETENARNRRSYLGEQNPAARLTRGRAMEIRRAPGSYAKRARQFGVSKSLVAQISRGELWT